MIDSSRERGKATSLLSTFSTEFRFFFLTDPAITKIYTLSLHDALPISSLVCLMAVHAFGQTAEELVAKNLQAKGDRKSTRLNSSHMSISYAVLCLKKKNSPDRDTAINIFSTISTDLGLLSRTDPADLTS